MKFEQRIFENKTVVSPFKLSFASGKFFQVQIFDFFFLAFLSKSIQKAPTKKNNPKDGTLERHKYDEYGPFGSHIDAAVGPQLRFETLDLSSGEPGQTNIVRVIHEVVC